MDSKSIDVILHLLLFLGIFSSAFSAPVNPRETVDSKTMNFLKGFGYLSQSDFSANGPPSFDDVVEAIKHMQAYAGLSPTGLLDSETKKLMNTTRCGMADVGLADKARRRKRRYAASGAKWKKMVLTWRMNYRNNDGLTEWEVRRVFSLALEKWASVTNLRFVEITSGEPDIWLKFVYGRHGDKYPFASSSSVLAHAFYPFPGNKELAGDVHFNDDTPFTINSRPGKNLLWVTIHELGHSIGLEHSNIQGAIMYPYYPSESVTDFDLTPDDILGAQAIYGQKSVSTPSIKEFTLPPSPRGCFSNVSAIFVGKDSRTYLFNGDKLYILRPTTLGVETGPVNVSTVFKGVDKVDAAFKRHRDGFTILLSGKNYFVFSGDTKYVAGPLPISQGFLGFSADFGDVDGAFIWPGNNLLYIFKGKHYWRVYENGMNYRVAPNYPRSIAKVWAGVPDDIGGVTVWSNRATYFFKGTNYYRLSSYLKLEKGYPKDVSIWTGLNSCSSPKQIVGDGKDSGSTSISEVSIATFVMSVALSILQMV